MVVRRPASPVFQINDDVKGQELSTPALTLHVKLEDRTDLALEHATQGVLFTFDDEDPYALRGYRGTVAQKIAGITYRQLDYWASKRILVPSINPSHGSGTRRLYSFKDIIVMAAAKKLLDAGVNLQNLIVAIGFLLNHITEELASITIISDGKQVRECTNTSAMLDLLNTGNAVFGVSLGTLWHTIEEALKGEEYIDVSEAPQSKPAVAQSPIDELRRARMQKTLSMRQAQLDQRYAS